MGLRSWLQSWLMEDLEGEVKQLRLELRELNDRLANLEKKVDDQEGTLQKGSFESR